MHISKQQRWCNSFCWCCSSTWMQPWRGWHASVIACCSCWWKRLANCSHTLTWCRFGHYCLGIVPWYLHPYLFLHWHKVPVLIHWQCSTDKNWSWHWLSIVRVPCTDWIQLCQGIQETWQASSFSVDVFISGDGCRFQASRLWVAGSWRPAKVVWKRRLHDVST